MNRRPVSARFADAWTAAAGRGSHRRARQPGTARRSWRARSKRRRHLFAARSRIDRARLLQRRGTDRNVSSFSRGRSATAAVELHRTAACRRRRQVESPPEHHGGTAPARPPAETHGRRFLQTPARTRTHRQGPADRLHRSQAPRGLGRDTRLRQPQRRPYREHQRRVAPPSR